MPPPRAEPPPPPCTHLMYLHGFRSSPQSAKARRLQAWVQAHRPAVHWCCPALPASPAAALARVEGLTAAWPAATSAVVGSSLGGFYATVLAETPPRLRWRVLLLNPAVNPARDLAGWVGEHAGWHDPQERVVFEPHFLDELHALTPQTLHHRARWLPIIATGDELLDWREMAAAYPGQPLHTIPGGDHALTDFESLLPLLGAHLGWQEA
jgi:uncharacterized protein